MKSLPIAECWNEIGVRGDRSCPELETLGHCHECPVFAEAANRLLERAAPEGYREERTALLATPISDEQVCSEAALVLRVANELLAIEAKSLAEVAEPGPSHSVAHATNRVFKGLVQIRGQLELLFSLHGLLELENARVPTTARAWARLVVVEAKGARWVFSADEVQGVHRFRPSEALEPSSSNVLSRSNHLRGVLRDDDRAIGWLDVDRLVESFERSLR